MDFYIRVSKVFAVFILLFVNFAPSSRGQTESVYRLKSGTKIHLVMDSEINSKVASVNDTFSSRVSKAVTIGTLVILPVGTVIEGRVTKVSSAGIGRKNGAMDLKFETMLFANSFKRPIDATLVNELKAPSTKTLDLVTILGGTAAGVLFGSVSKVENGALIGAGVGGGVATGIAIIRKGRDVRIRSDEEFEIELNREVMLPADEY